jgi:hypothetical protein
MWDTFFEDMLGEFTLRERRRLELGSVIGVWVEAGGRRAYFQPQEPLVEKARATGLGVDGSQLHKIVLTNRKTWTHETPEI